MCACVKWLQSCPTLCNPMNHSLPGSSVHGILQASILEWVAMPSSRGSSQPRDRTPVSYVCCIDRQVLYHKHPLGSIKRPVCCFYKAAKDTFLVSSCSDAVIIFDSCTFAVCQGTSHLFSGTPASPISKKGNEWHSHRIHMPFDNRTFRLNWQNWFLGEGTTSMLQNERLEIDV